MKISAYHKGKGDIVGFNIDNPHITYTSCIFSSNANKCITSNSTIIGGTGYDINLKLPDHIEYLKPDYMLYPSTYSQGFTTRGCIRSCKFCIVRQKEGRLKIWQHPYAFHDDNFNTCMIMDNNLLAADNSWIKSVLSWYSDTGIKILEHGLDARLLTEEYAGMLADIKLTSHGIKFAWDNISDETYIRNAVQLLKATGINLRLVSFYVLVGYNSTPAQDIYRCNTLKSLGVCSYVMRYNKSNKLLNSLARWANARQLYWSMDFDKYSIRKDGQPMVEIYKEMLQ